MRLLLVSREGLTHAPVRIGMAVYFAALALHADLGAWGTHAQGAEARPGAPAASAHPRLYFNGAELEALRDDKTSGARARIWDNMTRSADWCRQQPIREQWIPTLADDPQYENLYDRFYAAMHDTAVVEHLALTSALSDPARDRYFNAAREWALSAARVWGNEAKNAPDASKAYAVLRVMKALAVAYDALYDRLTPPERAEIRQSLVSVGNAYYAFFQQPSTAGEGYNKHHGSVDAAPFGIMALALLGEVPEAQQWLDNAVEKHVEYLLPHALTPSGTNEQSSNFWASTLQYRILFIDPLRRVTGRDLFAEFPNALPGNIALAAVAGRQPRDLEFNEDHRSVLFGPSYGQINYWSPVMIYLARHHQQGVFQHLASWDASLGALHRTRYITPNLREELLFCFGPYAYIWYDRNVPAEVAADVPLSFEFPEPEVGEFYLRDSFEQNGIVVGMKQGGLAVHAGGRAILVDLLGVADVNNPAEPVETTLSDDGRVGVLECNGPSTSGIGRQRVELRRPGSLSILRDTTEPISWWRHGRPDRIGNAWQWPDGTRLEVLQGAIASVEPGAHVDVKTHYGGMAFADPHPFAYDKVTVNPVDGKIELAIRRVPPSGSKSPPK